MAKLESAVKTAKMQFLSLVKRCGSNRLNRTEGTDGKDASSINITTDNGKQTLVNREAGADGKPGKTAQRITYVPVDQNGKPLKDEMVKRSNVKLQP